MSEFERQAREYEESGNLADGFFKLLNVLFSNHPFPVVRIVELRRWFENGNYKEILSGQYVKRDEAAKTKIKDDVVQGIRDYKEKFQTTKDPLGSFMREMFEAGEEIISEFSKKRKSSGSKED